MKFELNINRVVKEIADHRTFMVPPFMRQLYEAK